MLQVRRLAYICMVYFLTFMYHMMGAVAMRKISNDISDNLLQVWIKLSMWLQDVLTVINNMSTKSFL